MPERKHTPGPWAVIGEVRLIGDPNSENGQHNLWSGRIQEFRREYRGEICYIQSCDDIGGISREESAANSRLIAAAPDMLEALVRAEQQLDYGQDDAALSILRAAIAKATGQ